jgi:hypothetical protein
MHRTPETKNLAQTLKEVSMKNKSISRMLTAACPMMVVCGVLALGASAVAQEPIQGSWIFTLSSSPGGGPPFSAVASFATGGVFLATGQNDRTLGTGDHPASELHGSWERIRGDRYGSTTYFFALDPTTGQAVGMLQTNQVFRLTSRNTLEGAANASFCDLQGENCVPIPGVSTVTGKRMIVKDLPAL